MNKNKKNRKGFTVVELVIVIAVIGILATVLVPTFGSVISDAKAKANLQEAKNIYTSYVAKHADEASFTGTGTVFVKLAGATADEDVYFKVVDGQINETAESSAPANTATIILAGGLCKSDCTH